MGKRCQPRRPQQPGAGRGLWGSLSHTHHHLPFSWEMFTHSRYPAISPKAFPSSAFCIAEQEPGLERVGVLPAHCCLLGTAIEGRLCPWQRTGPAGAHTYASQNGHSLELSSLVTPAQGLLPGSTGQGGQRQAAVGFAKLSPQHNAGLISLCSLRPSEAQSRALGLQRAASQGKPFLPGQSPWFKRKKNIFKVGG